MGQLPLARAGPSEAGSHRIIKSQLSYVCGKTNGKSKRGLHPYQLSGAAGGAGGNALRICRCAEPSEAGFRRKISVMTPGGLRAHQLPGGGTALTRRKFPQSRVKGGDFRSPARKYYPSLDCGKGVADGGADGSRFWNLARRRHTILPRSELLKNGFFDLDFVHPEQALS